MPQIVNKDLAQGLILDELFDLSLYKSLREITSGPLHKTLEELIPIETRHYAFWQKHQKTHSHEPRDGDCGDCHCLRHRRSREKISRHPNLIEK